MKIIKNKYITFLYVKWCNNILFIIFHFTSSDFSINHNVRRNLHHVHSLNIGLRETYVNAITLTVVLVVEVINFSAFNDFLN